MTKTQKPKPQIQKPETQSKKPVTSTIKIQPECKISPVEFLSGRTGKSEVKFNERIVPSVVIKPEAAQKMRVYIEEMTDEIGWLGTTSRSGNTIFIEDCYLFRQEVHGTTTEITAEGLEEFGNEILQRPDGIDIWNSLKLWGHSHVTMPTSPSGQDDKQMEEFSTNGHDYFVRLIANKAGSIRIDVYEYDKGIEFHNVEWTIESEQNMYIYQNEMEIMLLEEKIRKLKREAREKEKQQADLVRPHIQNEIKEKVTALSYGYTNWPSSAVQQFQPFQPSYLDMDEPFTFQIDRFFNGAEDIESFFSLEQLQAYARFCYTEEEFLEEIINEPFAGDFSRDDVTHVWKAVEKVQSKMHDPANYTKGGLHHE